MSGAFWDGKFLKFEGCNKTKKSTFNAEKLLYLINENLSVHQLIQAIKELKPVGYIKYLSKFLCVCADIMVYLFEFCKMLHYLGEKNLFQNFMLLAWVTDVKII